MHTYKWNRKNSRWKQSRITLRQWFGFIRCSNKGTIAGYLSCNYAGSRRFKVGSVRDHILGFKA